MTTKTTLSTKKKTLPPKEGDFGSNQINLFQDLLCNTDEERDSLSNVFDLWDGIPRFSISVSYTHLTLPTKRIV